ncbi:polysaccharide deacetylase family protein [Cytophagaceae bacterium ABcell3]|nr:polysaccharide deacetylase family protein [Cytophagaceae bacterium ABcell3]
MRHGITSLLCLIVLFLCNCNKHQTDRQPGVCISFDDRFVDEWYEIKDLLDTYDAKVTFFVTQFDSLSPSEIDKLKALQDAGHEIASHGALHVISEHYIKEHSYKKYLDDEINHNIATMEKHGFPPKTFAYPYGAKYWFTDYLLKNRFNLLRGVASHNKEKDLSAVSKAYYRFEGNRVLDALGIDHLNNIPKDMMSKALQRAAAHHEVLLLFGHKPTHNPSSDSYEVDIEFLTFILKEAQQKGLKFYRFNELYLQKAKD